MTCGVVVESKRQGHGRRDMAFGHGGFEAPGGGACVAGAHVRASAKRRCECGEWVRVEVLSVPGVLPDCGCGPPVPSVLGALCSMKVPFCQQKEAEGGREGGENETGRSTRSGGATVVGALRQHV